MAYTQAQHDALEAAVAAGVLTVRHSDGKTVTYRSQAEMIQLLESMRSELGTGTVKRRYVSYSKGL